MRQLCTRSRREYADGLALGCRGALCLSGGALHRYHQSVGLWEHQDEQLCLRIYDDATWEFVNDQDEVIEYGTLWVNESGVTFRFDSVEE